MSRSVIPPQFVAALPGSTPVRASKLATARSGTGPEWKKRSRSLSTQPSRASPASPSSATTSASAPWANEEYQAVEDLGSLLAQRTGPVLGRGG